MIGLALLDDPAALHGEKQRGLGCGRGFRGVVVDVERGETGKQLDQVVPARVVAVPDVPLGDVVASALDPGAHARDVQIGTRERDVPDVDGDAGGDRGDEQLRDGSSAERGLEREVAALGDRALEQPLALDARRPRWPSWAGLSMPPITACT
jgi:hypothetical protein